MDGKRLRWLARRAVFEPGAALWRTTADNPLAWKSALVVHEMVLGMLHEG